MPDFGEIVSIETRGPTDTDQGISLGGGMVLREDGEILSPDVPVHPLDASAPLSDIRDVILNEVKEKIKDKVESEALDQTAERLAEKIVEYMQDAANYDFGEFSDLVEAALEAVAKEIMGSINILELSQMILEAILALL